MSAMHKITTVPTHLWKNVRGRNRGYKEEPRRPAGQSRVSSPLLAPGSLRLVQALLNTVGPQVEELDTPGSLSDWLSRNGLLPAGTELTRSDLERIRDTRSGLRALLATHSGGTLDQASVALLNRAAVGARAHIRFDRDGTSRFELISRDLDDALGILLGFVHLARAEGKWPAFKLCGHPGCRRAFFDFTKNRNGKWCTRRCGDKIRAKAKRRAEKLGGR